MENGSKGAVVAWFVGGIALGAAVALLLAPRAGEETRKNIAKSARKGQKSLLESSQDIISKGRELYERGRELAEEAAEIFERGRRIAEKSVDDRI